MARTETILGIHINAPTRVGRAIRSSRRHVGRYFGSQEFSPHITLYLSRFRRDSFRRLVKDFQRQPPQTISLAVSGLYVDRLRNGRTFLGLNVRPSKALMKLHGDILHRANVLRKGLIRTKDRQRMKIGDFSAAEKKRILAYGYSRVLGQFHPHFTIGTLDDSTNRAKTLATVRAKLVPVRKYSWLADNMVVGLYTYDLQKQKYVGRPTETTIRLGRF